MGANAELVTLARQHLYPNYAPAPLAFVRGRGCELFDADGRRWLDLCGGVAACTVGHGRPELARAIGDQAGALIHVSNFFYNEPNVRLAAELSRRTLLERVFFCNSGSEACEAMLKLARRHFFAMGRERPRVIAFNNAFHGRTLGALALADGAKSREGFGPLGPVTHVPFGDLSAVERAMGPDVRAIVVEPVQGQGGVHPASTPFLTGLRAVADAHGALLLVDEVQTGVGRLGTFLGIGSSGVRADAVALAKGLAGGVPIGAMLTSERLAEALPPGTHGSTFGGNALASAAGLAVLDIMDKENLVDAARVKGEILGALLGRVARDLPEACEGIRGRGLLWGLILRPGLAARETSARVQDAGVLVSSAGERVLRLTPPLVITLAELEEGVNALRLALSRLRPRGKDH